MRRLIQIIKDALGFIALAPVTFPVAILQTSLTQAASFYDDAIVGDDELDDPRCSYTV